MKLIDYSIKNPVFSNLLMATIIIFGLYVGFNLPKELFPSVGFEKVTILTIHENSTAEDVEKLITIPIEDKISSISGIKNIKSQSSESRSFIIAELFADEDTEEIAQEIRSEISQIKNDLPDDIDDPIIKDVKGSAPLINVSIGSNGDKNELRFYAKRLKDKLERLGSIESLIESGYGELVFWIYIDQKKLLQYNININEVIDSIKSRNIDLPAGALELGNQEYTIRTKGKIESIYELEGIPLNKKINKMPMILKDIARIELGQEEDMTLSRINGFASISFWIEKQKNKDAIETVEKIKDVIKNFKKTLPDGIEVFVSNDSSYWVKGRFDSMVKTGIYGIIAVLLILSMFLDYRSAFLAALGLPVAFFGAFILMQYTGESLNVITMFGLIMVLGIVVDDAIIVVENVKRYIQKGLPPKEAASKGAKEVAWPVIATIMTNIASLFPILLAEGTLGIFLSIIPQVAIFALVFSLVEALTILPSHCADFVRVTKDTGFFVQQFEKLRRKYLRILIACLRMKYKVLALSFGLLLLTTFILLKIPFVLLYSSDINQYLIKIQNSSNYSLNLTAEKASQVEEIVKRNTSPKLLKNYLTTLGVDFSKKPPQYGDHISNVLVQFHDFEERDTNGLESMKKIQKIVGEEIVGPASIEFVQTTGPPKGKDLDIRIIGDDTLILNEISKELKAFLRSKKGVYGVSDNLTFGKPRLSLKIDEQKAAMYGVDTRTVGKEIRLLIDGIEIDNTRVNDEEAKIKLKIENQWEKQSIENISNHLVVNSRGEFVPISNFSKAEISSNLLGISRYNRQRAASVTAEIDEDITTPREVINSALKFYKTIDNNYPDYKLVLAGEEQDTRESLESVKRASIISILLIYLILATILRSYIQPILIMSVLPFTIIGVTVGILLRGDPISITGLIGVVALLGVVVNDSLILMNFINKSASKNGFGFSVFYSAKNRFRAIILTTLTTFGGLATLMFQTRGEAAYLAPMAISLGVGLAFATLITLVLIPSLYLAFVDFKKRFSGIRT
ncbi:MAG: efflux RND transporter permease subunit [Thermodesulfobacteriota bacterium]|nr:efflux RND transporter permease subunit [Thermodesulfobacteriota bacterium]